MINVLGEILVQPHVWLTLIFLVICGWLMQRLINRLALMCQSVHVIHVPYGILIITLLTYLNGYIDYKAVVVMALFYLVSYPSMWRLNYNFTQTLGEILRQKQVTRETTGTLIWADETKLVLRIKRWWRRLFGKRLNAEIVDWIMDQRGTNGYHVRHYYQPENIKRDN